MKAFFLITRSVTGRLLGLRRSIGLFVLTGSIAPILLVLAPGRSGEWMATFYNDITVGLGFSILFPVAALVVSTAALGEERKSHTLPFLLLKPVSRWVVSLGVITAAALASFVILGAGVIASWTAAAVVTGDWSIGVSTAVAAAVQSVASAALFVPLGLVVGRAAVAGLGYLLIWEVTLGNVIEGIQASSIYRIVVSAWADLAALTPDNLETVTEVLGRVEVGVGGRGRQGRRTGDHLGHRHRVAAQAQGPGPRIIPARRHGRLPAAGRHFPIPAPGGITWGTTPLSGDRARCRSSAPPSLAPLYNVGPCLPPAPSRQCWDPSRPSRWASPSPTSTC